MHEARATKIRLSRVRDEESLILKDEDLAVVPLLSRTSSNTSERRQSHERLLRKSFDKNFIDREAAPCEEGEGKFCNDTTEAGRTDNAEEIGGRMEPPVCMRDDLPYCSQPHWPPLYCM